MSDLLAAPAWQPFPSSALFRHINRDPLPVQSSILFVFRQRSAQAPLAQLQAQLPALVPLPRQPAGTTTHGPAPLRRRMPSLRRARVRRSSLSATTAGPPSLAPSIRQP